jgi:hypothetical protein
LSGREIPEFKLKKAVEEFQRLFPGWAIPQIEERVKRGYRMRYNESGVFTIDHINSSYDQVVSPFPDWHVAEEMGEAIAIEEQNTKLNKYLNGE